MIEFRLLTSSLLLHGDIVYVFDMVEFRLSGPLDIMELRRSKLFSRIDFSNLGDLGMLV